MGGKDMTDIKPVGMATSSRIYVNDEGEALLMLLALKGGKEVLLYTADALRAAQVQVLERLARHFEHRTFCSTDVRQFSKEKIDG